MTIALDSSEWTLERIKAVADFAHAIVPDRELTWRAGQRFYAWFDQQGTVTVEFVPDAPQSDFIRRSRPTTICGIVAAEATDDYGAPNSVWEGPLELFCTTPIPDA